MKKKIGIITLHFAHNVGAMLQAYALSNVVGRYAECSIVNYCPDYHVKQYDIRKQYYHPIQVAASIGKQYNHGIKICLLRLYNYFLAFKNPVYRNAKIKSDKFNAFSKKNFKVTKICRLVSDVEALNCFDALIVGSDQLWNKSILNGKYDPVYFLNLRTSAQKYSYAVSAGDTIPNEDLCAIKEILRSFDGLSVREKSLEKQLVECQLDAHVDLDPTLLLDEKDYYRLESDLSLQNEFIFIYCFDVSNELIDVVRELKKKWNCDVVVWSMEDKLQDKLDFEVIELSNAGPSDFLYYIDHAKYVVTSSFHGTAFSIIYRKQFVVLKPYIGEDRIITLLSSLNLMDHYRCVNKNLVFDEEYLQTNALLLEKQEKSVNYIKSICI